MGLDARCACLSDITVEAFIAGRFQGAELARLETHASQCATCHKFIANAAGGVMSTRVQTDHPAQKDLASTADLLRPNELVEGKYRAESVLGHGAMRTVFAAGH